MDELTQQQYLGETWTKLEETEKEKHLKSRFNEFQTNINTGYSFIAESNGIIVGFIFAFENLPYGDELIIRHITVHPKFQRRGIGTKLYLALIAKAREETKTLIDSWINIDNPKSIILHEKMGFNVNDWKRATLDLEILE